MLAIDSKRAELEGVVEAGVARAAKGGLQRRGFGFSAPSPSPLRSVPPVAVPQMSSEMIEARLAAAEERLKALAPHLPDLEPIEFS